MVKKSKKTIEEVLDSLEPKQKKTTQELRTLIKNAVPETVEIVRLGKITYTLEGKDFVWLIQAKTHVDLEFLMGGSLDSDLLKTNRTKEKRENVRLIKVKDVEALKPELLRLLKDAERIGLEHCKTKPKA